MKAAKQFLLDAKKKNLLNSNKIKMIRTELYGSLALTGKGHATDKAVLMGLMGEEPETVDTTTIYDKIAKINLNKKIRLMDQDNEIPFSINFHKFERLPYHTNGMRFIMLDDTSREVYSDVYYSIGGGFILKDEETKYKPVDETVTLTSDNKSNTEKVLPFPFNTAQELMEHCRNNNMTIPQVILENEKSYHSEEFIKNKMDQIWKVMDNCITRGMNTPGILPGPLKVERRAPTLYKQLLKADSTDPMNIMNWINMFALAVSEENAVGGQVVTAPTNGAAGIIPSVLKYYEKYYSKKHPNKLYDFLLTAASIGMIFKKNATISGAEGGCQAEIGVAASMAAGGLTSALGGNLDQVEKAAEIAMEHFLGMTCDPIGGLVQIPCIERNALGSVKAINSVALALNESSKNKVSLDRVVHVMRETGNDMMTKYKETAKGGLAKEFKLDCKKPKDKKGVKSVLDNEIIYPKPQLNNKSKDVLMGVVSSNKEDKRSADSSIGIHEIPIVPRLI
jgi:L-serine dehydratase